MNPTDIYTDGACRGNPGPGGWAWLVPGDRWAIGCQRRATNQQMELHAVLEAVRAHPDDPLRIHSDSQYVVTASTTAGTRAGSNGTGSTANAST